MQIKIGKLGEQIMKESFGFEHLIREMGQIYEAVSLRAGVRDNSIIKLLPRKVAEQLLLGNCIELMDGENSFIPVNWIKAVMNELDSLCGQPFVSVQSIVGEQSSGKSTFLNV